MTIGQEVTNEEVLNFINKSLNRLSKDKSTQSRLLSIAEDISIEMWSPLYSIPHLDPHVVKGVKSSPYKDPHLPLMGAEMALHSYKARYKKNNSKESKINRYVKPNYKSYALKQLAIIVGAQVNLDHGVNLDFYKLIDNVSLKSVLKDEFKGLKSDDKDQSDSEVYQLVSQITSVDTCEKIKKAIKTKLVNCFIDEYRSYLSDNKISEIENNVKSEHDTRVKNGKTLYDSEYEKELIRKAITEYLESFPSENYDHYLEERVEMASEKIIFASLKEVIFHELYLEFLETTQHENLLINEPLLIQYSEVVEGQLKRLEPYNEDTRAIFHSMTQVIFPHTPESVILKGAELVLEAFKNTDDRNALYKEDYEAYGNYVCIAIVVAYQINNPELKTNDVVGLLNQIGFDSTPNLQEAQSKYNILMKAVNGQKTVIAKRMDEELAHFKEGYGVFNKEKKEQTLRRPEDLNKRTPLTVIEEVQKKEKKKSGRRRNSL